jgi:alpha-L-fucosidase
MKWWREARFGLFIHWGVYAVPRHVQWSSGQPYWRMDNESWENSCCRIPGFAKEFNPVKYDADAWVKMAKDAGMKYIVITAKHHDGFALFDSKATKWDVVDATPYKKDLLKPLAAACKKYGIKLGFYYSQAQDWNNPGGAARVKLLLRVGPILIQQPSMHILLLIAVTGIRTNHQIHVAIY